MIYPADGSNKERKQYIQPISMSIKYKNKLQFMQVYLITQQVLLIN